MSVNPVRMLRRLVGATQAELARRAETSQPTIAAYESGRKSPSLRTLQRLATSVGQELHVVFVPPMTREDQRSLELHRAIAEKLVADPASVVRKARKNVELMIKTNPEASALLRAWRQALSLPTSDLLDLLDDPRPRARELRHVSPFAGVLTPGERWDLYRRFGHSDRAA
jgi:transcriptional regulator with XRE-family HTH domain